MGAAAVHGLLASWRRHLQDEPAAVTADSTPG